MNFISRTLLLCVCAAVTVALAGCAPMRSPIATSAAPSAGTPKATQLQIATVERSTITPVLTVDASVLGSVNIAVTALQAGTFQIDSRGNMSVVTPSGYLISEKLGPSDRDVVPLVGDGARVAAGQPIIHATYGGLALTAMLKPADLLKFIGGAETARAQIDGLGAPFSCSLLDPIPTTAADGSESIACAVPADQQAISGLTGVISIRFPSARDVLVLPLTAIAGTKGSGEIFQVVAGKLIRQSVKLGVSNGNLVEVVSGVKDGEQVAIPGPDVVTNG